MARAIWSSRSPGQAAPPTECACSRCCSAPAARSISVISPAATEVMERELGVTIDLTRFDAAAVARASKRGRLEAAATTTSATSQAGIASGSFLTAGMVVCPCSMGTVAAIAHGTSENLIHRAADVHLKERRKLVLVPRETPLGLIQLRNLTAVAEAGAVVLPAMPAFYTLPKTVDDMIDFVVGRVCDQLGVEHGLLKRWGAGHDPRSLCRRPGHLARGRRCRPAGRSRPRACPDRSGLSAVDRVRDANPRRRRRQGRGGHEPRRSKPLSPITSTR